MSQLKDDEDVEPTCIHIISDSEDSNMLDNGFAGFPSVQKNFPTDGEQIRTPSSARKKLKIDGYKEDFTEEAAIDIDSISTNPRRTRTKVSSDTSSKFPVSSPSDAIVTGHRKKYVKNTLPAGAFERMLNEVAQSHPLMTYKEKLDKWKCSSDLSDVEDVNNFDDQFRKREQTYKRSISVRRVAGNESPSQKYNYQHFRMVVLENLKGSPIACTPSPEGVRPQNNAEQPSCSKQLDPMLGVANITPRSEPNSVIYYEKILCPSSESTATKASPPIHLHWTDEDSGFRLKRLNPEIDKFSKLIKLRVDYKKQVNLKAKINEIFKTPTVPSKYNCGCDSPDRNNGIESAKSVKEHADDGQNVAERKIETRRSTGGKSADSRRSGERKSTERRSSDKFPEVNPFQQDEFCNYLGLGVNGKVYSPTPTDNKRRSLRVRRQQQQVEPAKKKKDKKESKKEYTGDKVNKINQEEEEEVTTTANETRNSSPSPLTIKALERSIRELSKSPHSQPPIAPVMDVVNKSPEIKILLQIHNSETPLTTPRHTPSTATTTNSVPPPTRRIRRTRATSNGTSTCPRSSQSDESPNKTTPRRRRLHHHTRHNNNASDLSESLQSDPQLHDNSPTHNGRASTVPSSEGKKEENPLQSQAEKQFGAECLHRKFQRFLEESRKTKPSIFIVDSIDNSGPKAEEDEATKNNEAPAEQPHKEKFFKGKKWSIKSKAHRRLLRKNGTIGSMSNQRILRNGTILRPLRIKISKHAMGMKIRAAKKKAIRKQLVNQKKTDQKLRAETVQLEIRNFTAETSVKKEGKRTKVQEEKCIQTENEIEIVPEEPCKKSQDDDVFEPICQEVGEKKTTEDAQIQTESYTPPLSIRCLTSAASRMKNPLSSANGPVVYAYYELDILTVVQNLMVTFWKASKLFQVLSKSTCEWMYLGECKRLLFDEEIKAPYKNRICVHNSIPIYMEMRAKELPKIRRDCNLISVYINVYYYHDEDLVAKSHSIQLDTVASLPQNVVFTTITDSRYFVMCWSQETMLGKLRSGLCKYSLTPHLDTLASIREFKSMRHEIRYLECTTDDNLIGFGDTQVTLWDHRSGDILMNYDLNFQLGFNVGSIYYPSLEVGQDNTVLIFQKTALQELSIIAINISHSAPSHRFVCTHVLPSEFADIQSSMRTDDYVILTNVEHQELWIDCSDPEYMMQIKTQQGQSRFYARCKQNVIGVADDHLALENFSNFVLKLITVRE